MRQGAAFRNLSGMLEAASWPLLSHSPTAEQEERMEPVAFEQWCRRLPSYGSYSSWFPGDTTAGLPSPASTSLRAACKTRRTAS